jgi:NADP-dependent 3-hydroxy acid dehydrogenase YdfG
MERFHLQDLESIDWMIDTNLKGAMYCTRMVVPSMIERGSGRIINVASVAGTWGMKNQVTYGASKHGLVGFGDALGRELAPLGVQRVLCTRRSCSFPSSSGTPGERARRMDLYAARLQCWKHDGKKELACTGIGIAFPAPSRYI